MEFFAGVIGIFSMILILVSTGYFVVSLIKKNGNSRKAGTGILIGVGLFFLTGIIITIVEDKNNEIPVVAEVDGDKVEEEEVEEEVEEEEVEEVEEEELEEDKVEDEMVVEEVLKEEVIEEEEILPEENLIKSKYFIEEVFNAYNDNELKANDTYKEGKHIITSHFRSADDDGIFNKLYGEVRVVSTLEQSRKRFVLYCRFDKSERDKLKEFSKGDLITFEGTLKNWSIWRDCKLK